MTQAVTRHAGLQLAAASPGEAEGHPQPTAADTKRHTHAHTPQPHRPARALPAPDATNASLQFVCFTTFECAVRVKHILLVLGTTAYTDGYTHTATVRVAIHLTRFVHCTVHTHMLYTLTQRGALPARLPATG